MSFKVSIIVAGLQGLREEWSDVREQCWADNTWKARKSQWRRYHLFCEDFRLTPLPAAAETIGLYITFLARKCCYVTICNYVSGVWALHDYWGIPHVDATTFLISSTLRGAKRLLGCESIQAPPLSPKDMGRIWYSMDLNKLCDVQFWCALTIMYRCLLRVSHVVTSPHTMKVKDLRWTDTGMDVTIRSSKVIQFKERVVLVPIVKASGSILCPCDYLRYYISRAGLKPESALFPYTYSGFSSKLKKTCEQAGLVGNYTSHSLRRGSATFLSSFLPLHVIKTYGDWRSWSVLLYISDSYTDRKEKDLLVAERLLEYK